MADRPLGHPKGEPAMGWEAACRAAWVAEDRKSDEIARLRAENDLLLPVAQQAVTLYEMLRAEDEYSGDAQGENFWEGHRDTALHALGRSKEIEAVAKAAIAASLSESTGDEP